MMLIILDTGCANLNSVKNAVIQLGYNPKISNTISDVLEANKLIIPGVGTAYSAIKMLKKKKLLHFLKNFKKPVLGICLGMQLLFKNSAESKHQTLLNIISKSVLKFKDRDFYVPHMGWNTINFNIYTPLLSGIPNNSYFYFAHSYYIKVMNLYTLAVTTYCNTFSSVIQKNNFFGVQFHPEKSGKCGLQLLKNFLEI